MAVNRFDQPVQVEYVSQYVPIPFEQLYKVGKEYNARFDQNQQLLADYNKMWKTFQSPITKDVENYRKIVMTPGITQLVNEAASNIDAMKTPEFRSKLQAEINNIDYAALGKLKQSAENAVEYQKAIRKMQQEGTYNPNWDTVDFSKYSTIGDGIFNLAAPIKFQTLPDLVDPYLKGIQPTFYGGKNPLTGERLPYTNWMAVSQNEIDRALSQRYNDILNTPQGKMWYRDIAKNVIAMNPNATAEDVDYAFMNALSAASSKHLQAKPIVDQVGLTMYKEDRADQRKKMDVTQDGQLVPFTELITKQGSRRYENMASGLFTQMISQNNPRDYEQLQSLNKQYQEAVKNNDTTKKTEIENKYGKLFGKYGISDYVSYIINTGKKDGYVTDKQLHQNIQTVASYLTEPYQGSAQTETALQSMPNSVKNEKNEYGLREVTNVGDYNLLSNTVLRLGKHSFTDNSSSTRIQNYLKQNSIKSTVTGVRGYMSTALGNLNVTTQAIKESDLLPLVKDNKGNPYNPNETDRKILKQYKENLSKLLQSAGFRKVSSQKLKGFSKNVDFNSDYPTGKSTGSLNYSYQFGDDYWESEFTNVIPRTQDPISSEINNFYDQLLLGQTGAKDQYGSRQQQADYAEEYYDK